MAKHILVFSGTIDGRKLIQKLLKEEFLVTASSLTEYGNDLLEDHALLSKRFGALGIKEIEDLIELHAFDAVVDATHPYAREISQNIYKACQTKNKTYLRLERKRAFKADEGMHFKSMQEACLYLTHQQGNILFTTGSNTIGEIVDVFPQKKRLFFRILPVKRSLDLATACGLDKSNIIALNPPFTFEENMAHIETYAIKYLVTKDSGIDGGCLEKAEAAKASKVQLIVIDRPSQLIKHVFYSDKKIIQEIRQL